MINFFAPINHLGYGIHSYNLISAYDKYISKEIALFPYPFQPDFYNDSIHRWVENGKRFNRNDPGININQAPWLNRFVGKPLIGFPVFEMDVLDDYEFRMISQMDFILQTSQWGKEVLKGHGLQNVFVVPEGYDPQVYYPTISLEKKKKRIQEQGITFIHVGKFEARKSSEEILNCFIQACEGLSEKTRLIFHVFNPFDREWYQKVQKVLLSKGLSETSTSFQRGSMEIIVPKDRTKGELRKFYQSAEFGIWASKAEGWNLPLIECIACGVPSITTDNTAQGDFIRKGIYPQELVLTTRKTGPSRPGAPWWPLDHEELIQKIRRIVNSPVKFLEMEVQCLESVREFTWENAARKLSIALKQIGLPL